MYRYFLMALALAGVATVGMTGFKSLQPVPAADASDQVQTAGLETFELRSSEAATTCAVTRGDTDSGGRAALKVEASCAALLPGVEKAKIWLDNGDGSVAFTENGVDPIITFAVADGVAYESLEPALPVISLDASGQALEESATH